MLRKLMFGEKNGFLIKNGYNDIYWKTSGKLWQYYRDQPALNDNGNIINLPGNSASFKLKVKNTRSNTC